MASCSDCRHHHGPPLGHHARRECRAQPPTLAREDTRTDYGKYPVHLACWPLTLPLDVCGHHAPIPAPAPEPAPPPVPEPEPAPVVVEVEVAVGAQESAPAPADPTANLVVQAEAADAPATPPADTPKKAPRKPQG